jgi:hypothetical protein
MLKRHYLCILAAAVTLASLPLNGKADSVPWGYSAGDGQISNSNNAASTSSINFTGANGVATGSSGIIIYNMTTSSSATDASPDSFANVPFDLAFTLTDVKATGSSSPSAKASQLMHVTGMFNASNVTNHSLLPGASPWGAPITLHAVLGSDDTGWRLYSVLLSSFTSPGQPGGAPGSIQAIVTITPGDALPPTGQGDPPPPPSAAPEPTSLLLAGVAVLPLIVHLRSRRIRIA